MELTSALEKIAQDQAGDAFYRLESEPSCTDDFRFFVNADYITLVVSVKSMGEGVVSRTFASHPIVTTTEAYRELISFCNALNRLEEQSLGKFVVNGYNLTYQSYCPEAILEADPKKAQKFLFVEGVRLWSSLAMAILLVSRAQWSSRKAEGYVREIYHRGIPDYDGVPRAR